MRSCVSIGAGVGTAHANCPTPLVEPLNGSLVRRGCSNRVRLFLSLSRAHRHRFYYFAVSYSSLCASVCVCVCSAGSGALLLVLYMCVCVSVSRSFGPFICAHPRRAPTPRSSATVPSEFARFWWRPGACDLELRPLFGDFMRSNWANYLIRMCLLMFI
jgi:hypothetical protein